MGMRTQTIHQLAASGHYTSNRRIWDGIARRVLRGGLKGITKAEKEAVLMGLRTFKTPATEKALTFLEQPE